MERKLVRQGRNALTVTLPAKWLRERDLEAGDVVQVVERSHDIQITTDIKRAKQEVTVDARGLERSAMYHIVLAKYIEGYDKITILHDNPKLAQEIVGTCLGMIIDEHRPTRTVYKSIIAVPQEDYQAVLRRAVHMLSEQAKMLQGVVNGEIKPEEVKREEKLLDNNILYCLRYLNKYERSEEAYKWFLLCSTLESAGDQITEIAQYVEKDKKLAKKVAKGVEQYTKMLFTHDLKQMVKMLKSFRNSVGTKTFVEGLAYGLAENLYNYIGYLIEVKKGK